MSNQIPKPESPLVEQICLASDGVIVCNNRQRIVMFNPSAEKIFQCPSTYALGLPLLHFVPLQIDGESLLPLEVEASKKSLHSVLMTNEKTPQILLRSKNKILTYEASHFKIFSLNEWLYALTLRPTKQTHQPSVMPQFDFPRHNQRINSKQAVDNQVRQTLNTVLEDQKRKLAQEMHDDFGQLLAAMKMDLDQITHELPLDNAKLAGQFENLNKLVDTMMVSVRRIIADLPPKNLDDYGLFKSIEMMVNDFEKRHEIECQLTLPKTQPKIDHLIEHLIYRIVQESLNNISKHADASLVEIEIVKLKDSLSIRIADNGKGMTKECLEKTESFGIRSLRDRITAAQGEMKLESHPQSGTSIGIRFPLYEMPAILSH